MRNLLRAEFFKLLKHKTYGILVGVTALQGVLQPLLSDPKSGAQTFFSIYQDQEYYTMMIFFAALAATFIASDFEQGVMKHPIAYGHKKHQVVLSKVIVYLFACSLLSFIVPLISVTINTMNHGFGTDELFIGLSQVEIISKLITTSTLMTLVYIGIASIAAAFAFLSRNSVMTITSFIGIDLLRRFVTIAAARNERISSLYSKTIFYQSDAILSEALSSNMIIQILAVCLATIIGVLTLSSFLVEKFDLR